MQKIVSLCFMLVNETVRLMPGHTVIFDGWPRAGGAVTFCWMTKLFLGVLNRF